METKKRFILFIAMLLTFSGLRAEGEVSFSIEEFSLMPGETTEVSLNMANTAIVQIFNGAIQMSEGLSFVSEYDEEEDAETPVHRTDRLHKKHEVGFNLKSANSLTFLIHSGTTRRDIAPGEGAVIKFKVKADEGMSLGKARITVSGLSAANSDNVELCSVKAFTTDVTIYKPVIEDENGNKYVSSGEDGAELIEIVQEPDENGAITIPATVDDEGNSLKVTGIASDAFANIEDKGSVTAIDLSATEVTGITVNRSEGIFSGFESSTLIYLPEGDGNLVAEGEKNVIIGGVCQEMEISENTDFNVTTPFKVHHLVFDREFLSGVTATVYLPFSIPSSEAAKLGTFHSFKEISAEGEAVFNAAETGDIEAYKPYIFVPSSAKIDITDASNNITVAVKGATAGTNGDLVGTTEAKTWTTAPEDTYGFAAEAKDKVAVGEFVKVGAGASIARYRAYLVIESTAAARSSYPVIISDQQTTGIHDTNSRNLNDGGKWYGIDGQEQISTPVHKGLYIRNGRKIIIR